MSKYLAEHLAEHPGSFELQAYFVGESTPDVGAHVSQCGRCRDELDALEQQRLALVSREAPADFARRVRLIADAQEQRKWWRWTVPAVGALAAAGLAIALWPASHEPPPAGAVPPRNGAPTDVVRWRGDVQVGVVIQRGGEQSRSVGRAEIAPGDALRVEVSLAEAAIVSSGVLGNDGTWTALGVDVTLPAGTHYVEGAVRVDETAESAWVVVGTPDDVQALVALPEANRAAWLQSQPTMKTVRLVPAGGTHR